MTLMEPPESHRWPETACRPRLELTDEIFLTSTASENVLVAELDRRRFERSSSARTVAERYCDAVGGRVADHRDWLTPPSAGVPT